MTPTIEEMERQAAISEAIDTAPAPDLDRMISVGDAVIAGRKVKIISTSDRYIWFVVKKKEFRMPRYFLFGICKQGGVYVI